RFSQSGEKAEIDKTDVRIDWLNDWPADIDEVAASEQAESPPNPAPRWHRSDSAAARRFHMGSQSFENGLWRVFEWLARPSQVGAQSEKRLKRFRIYRERVVLGGYPSLIPFETRYLA